MAILGAGRKQEAVLWKGGGTLSCACSGSTREDMPGVLEGDHELTLSIKHCRFVCVGASNPDTVKFIGIYHKRGKTERGRAKEFLMCWRRGSPYM